MIIKKNPDWSEEKHLVFAQKVAENGGHCPCMLAKTDETRCLCKEFRDIVSAGIAGECHCGRFISAYETEDNHCI